MLMQKEILKTMEDDVAKMCTFATLECSRTLSNLHSCGTGEKLILADKHVATVVREHGVRMATEMSKLGAASLHRDDKETTVMPCKATTASLEEDKSGGNGNPKLFGGIVVAFTFALLIGGMLYHHYKKKRTLGAGDTSSRTHDIGAAETHKDNLTGSSAV